ncbi:MAG: hypothetical protein ACPLKS_06130 [Caldisericum exile]|uniref:hypothetical protein n=1 Tax=Caldisericum exile TaxID=693075 RepID=UPI003C711B77
MNIIVRPKKVLIGKASETAYDWTGVLRVEYEEESPWVHIDIPGGLMVHQHIKSPHVRGVISCVDLDSFKTALFDTVIDDENHKAIDTSNFYTKWTVKYLRIIVVNESMVEQYFDVDNFKVDRIEVENVELGREAIFKVYFTADRVLISST